MITDNGHAESAAPSPEGGNGSAKCADPLTTRATGSQGVEALVARCGKISHTVDDARYRGPRCGRAWWCRIGTTMPPADTVRVGVNGAGKFPGPLRDRCGPAKFAGPWTGHGGEKFSPPSTLHGGAKMAPPS